MFEKSLDQIIASFSKVQTDLDNYVGRQMSALTAERDEAQRLLDVADAREEDVKRASNIRNNISKLLDG